MKPLLILICLFTSSLISNSQLKPRERLYLQLDKKGYTAGETIWFKAYSFENFSPDDNSTTIFVDLIDAAGTVVIAKQLPIFGGTAVGNIDLSLPHPQGVYYLVCYTKAATPTDATNVYTKPVYIFNPKSVTSNVATIGKEYNFKFYTASDILITGIKNTIFFKGADRSDLPAKIKGSIINGKKEELLSFTDAHNGMGKFVLMPLAGEKYYARVIFPDGIVKEFPLPDQLDNAVAINVENDIKGKLVTINIPNFKTKMERYTVIGIMDNNVVFKQSFPVAETFKCLVTTKDLPTGAMRLFVMDDRQISLAERATFINTESSYVPIKFVSNTLNTSAKGKNVFSLIFPDTTNGTFSVSITDYDRELRLPQNNIIADLLLQPQGQNNAFINNVDIQNGVQADNEKLELFVATIKWPAIQLDKILNATLENEALDTNYITIRGNVLKRNGKPITKGELTFIFQGKDSSFSFLRAPIQSDGSFLLKNLVYYDTAIFKYQLNQKQEEVFIKLDSVKNSFQNFSALKPNTIFIDQTVFKDPEFVKHARENYDYMLDTFSNIKKLREVIVVAKKGTPTQQVNDKYTRGLFQNSNMARVVDLINNPPNLSGNILDYLQGRVVGLTISKNGSEYLLAGRGGQLSISNTPQIKLFLNEQEVSQIFVTMIPLYEIAMVKYYPPGNSMLSGVGIAGVLAIYTKKFDDINYPSKSVLSSFTYPGYSSIKYFETANLSQAAAYNKRTTLYWDPYIFINNDKKKYTMKFENSTVAKRFHVVIEGFTSDGRLLYFDKIIE